MIEALSGNSYKPSIRAYNSDQKLEGNVLGKEDEYDSKIKPSSSKAIQTHAIAEDLVEGFEGR